MTGHLVGITGYATSGKDTFAKSLALRGGFHVMGMSDALVNMARVLNPLLQYDDGQLFELNRVLDAVGYTEAKKIPSVREYLQRLGTEAVRDILGNDAWVNAAERKFYGWLENDEHVAVTGIRFPNEANMIKRFGGTIVKILRNGTEPSNGHSSDTELDTLPVDVVVFNNGTVDDLGKEASKFLRTLGV
jgi:deoxynucleotide monophosphate kinase-like protein